MEGVTYLLDTHVLLWWLFHDRHLSATATKLIANPENRIEVSSASAWEIATKHRLGKLDGVEALCQDFPGWLAKAGFDALPISIAHAQRAGSWEHAHRDPFDRMLAAQSELEDIPLVTSDRALRTFGVTVVW